MSYMLTPRQRPNVRGGRLSSLNRRAQARREIIIGQNRRHHRVPGGVNAVDARHGRRRARERPGVPARGNSCRRLAPSSTVGEVSCSKRRRGASRAREAVALAARL